MNAKIIIASFAAVVAVACAAPATTAVAAELPAKSRVEITYLLERLGKSDCEFNRNGSWHSAADARDHLQTKFDYLVKKNLLASAEDFIKQGASKSSMSGKAYAVKCANGTAVDSALWLTTELRRYRQQAATH